MRGCSHTLLSTIFKDSGFVLVGEKKIKTTIIHIKNG